MSIITLRKSGVNGAALVSSAVHGIAPISPSSPGAGSGGYGRLRTFGVFREVAPTWGSLSAITGTRDGAALYGQYSEVATRVDFPFGSGGFRWWPEDTADARSNHAILVQMRFRSIVAQGSSQFGPSGTPPRMSAHIPDDTGVVRWDLGYYDGNHARTSWSPDTYDLTQGVQTFVFYRRWVTAVQHRHGIILNGKIVAEQPNVSGGWSGGSPTGWSWNGCPMFGFPWDTPGNSNLLLGAMWTGVAVPTVDAMLALSRDPDVLRRALDRRNSGSVGVGDTLASRLRAADGLKVASWGTP